MKPDRFVPLEKRSKKQRREHFASQRSDWNGVTPVTRVIPDKRKTDRHEARIRLKQEQD